MTSAAHTGRPRDPGTRGPASQAGGPHGQGLEGIGTRPRRGAEQATAAEVQGERANRPTHAAKA